jgi:hypothetical protein
VLAFLSVVPRCGAGLGHRTCILQHDLAAKILALEIGAAAGSAARSDHCSPDR